MVAGKSIIAVGNTPHLDKFETMLKLSQVRGANPKAIQQWTNQAFANRFDSLLGNAGIRHDSVAFATDRNKRNDSALDGMHLARDLEYIHAEVMKEPRPEFEALDLFPVSNRVPAGAREHTIRRRSRFGDAKIHRAGQKVPLVGLSQVEETFPVKHLVAGYRYDIFDQMSDGFARSGVIQGLALECRDEITALWDELTWLGSDDDGLYGVLNYPWLNKKVSGVQFSAAADPLVLLAELHALANQPSELSKRTFAPDVMVMGDALYNLLSTMPKSADSDKTVLQYFVETNAHIKEVRSSWRLSEAGPGGTDGILVYRNDQMGIRNELVQGVTPLPLQSDGFEFFVYMYSTIGGVVMGDVGNNALMWVERA